MGRVPTGMEAADVGEESTAPASLSSQLSSERANQVSVNPGQPVSAQKSTAGVEQAKPAMPDEPSLWPAYVRESGAASAGENFIKSSEATESTFDRGAQIKQPSTVPLRKETAQHDRAAIGEVPLSSPAKTATAPFILNQPVSDSAFGQTHAGPFPPSSAAAWMASSPSLDASAVNTGKTAPLHEPFAAMDAARNDGAVRWVLADSHRAEAGFQDPSLGWVSVRAQAGAAGIHASVMPASGAAAEVLSGHLAGLNAHLASHYEHMNAVILSPPGNGWNSRDAERELTQGNGSGPSQGGQQQAREHSEPTPSQPVRQFANGLLEERTSTELPVFPAGMSPQDRHISVVV